MSTWKRRQVFSWACYDWANSAFSTTVMAGFFPLFFKQYWAVDVSAGESTFMLGGINAFASILVVIVAPILGAIADRGGSRKRFLIYFAIMGIVMTGGLSLASQGNWAMALALYGLAIIGFSSGNVFYDSLLVNVAEEREYDVVSALGFSFGYLGGGVLFAVNVLMTLYPEAFGLPDAATAVRISFFMVAVWWALFSIPLLLFVHEPQSTSVGMWRENIRDGFNQLRSTISQLRQLKQVVLFLLAYWFYIDGVDTIVRMAVDYGLALGFNSNDLITALLITQFIGFPSALLFGRLGKRKGARFGIMLAIFVYWLVILWASRMQEVWEFYAMAVAIGLVQGGIQSLSRSFFARIIPRNKAGEFFGFYNMLGKFAAVLGPLMMGGVSLLSGSPRFSILSVSLLFIIGALLLSRVNEEQAKQQAMAFEKI